MKENGDFSFPPKFIIYKRLLVQGQPLFYFKKEMIFIGQDYTYLFVNVYKMILVLYLLLLLLVYVTFAYAALADNELFSFKEVIEHGVNAFLFFFYFSISNAIVYPLCYLFRKHLSLEE